jgi:hypothetical protein
MAGSLDQFTGFTNGSAVSSQTQSIFDGVGLPWSELNSRFYQQIQIDPTRWDQLYPYRLMVIDTKNNNQIVNGTDPADAKFSVTTGTGATIINFQTLTNQWIFQLPISPEQLKISDQYAISTSATLRGVMEEHGGVKFKNIMASGSFGVWPYKESVVKPPGQPGIASSLFGGTLSAVGNLQTQFTNVVNAATGTATKPTNIRPESSTAGEKSTGYYQALALTQFLEQYAEAKKDPKNSGWRLVFDIPKQSQAFVVTPMAFDWTQSVQDPMAIHYSMQLKAWRRIDLNESAFVLDPNVQILTPGILQRILNTLASARATLSASLNLISAVRSDVEAPLDALRQTSLLVKDIAGVLITAADLPFQIQSDYKSAISAFLGSVSLSNLSGIASSAASVLNPLKAIKASSLSREGLSLDAVSSGQLGSSAAQAQSVDPALNVFSKPQANFSLMDQAPVHALTLSTAQQNAVNQVVQSARLISVDDLKAYRATIQDLTLQLSNSFGAGNSYYSKIYGKSVPTARVQPMTLDEYDILKQLYDVLQCYDILTATKDIDNRNAENNMAYVSGLASDSGILFSVPDSKIQLPVPFGLTVEAIALRYLGDAQRWLEIVTLNNLRAPYIDENGFKLPLLSNATGRQITVANADNLFVGQRGLVCSGNQSPSARVILNIDKLSASSHLITLDGLANLDNYNLANKAYFQAYLPGTVNSQQKIFIPSDATLPTLPNIVPPASTSSDPLVGLSKVDFLLTESGDLAINSFGDFRLASGITNLIQAVKIKIGTPRGAIGLHQEFGLGIKPGISNSEVQVQEIYKSISKLIKQDPRFAGLASLQIVLTGPTLTINMGVRIANNRGIYPLSFTLT